VLGLRWGRFDLVLVLEVVSGVFLFFFFFITLGLELSDKKVYEP